MNRFMALLWLDLRLQWRYGFYFASAFFVLMWAAVLTPLPDGAVDFALLFPAIAVSNLLLVTFFYVSGLVLLEKAEGSFVSHIVTPIEVSDYLWAKSLSLTVLGVAETAALLLFTNLTIGTWWLLALGLLFLGIVYTLFGFSLAARYDTINDFLLPAIGVVLVLLLPLVVALELYETMLVYVHPIYPMIVLTAAAFEAASTSEIMYGLIGGCFWLGMAFLGARRSYDRFAKRASGLEG